MKSIQENGFEIVPARLNRERLVPVISALESRSLPHSRAGIRNALQAPEIRSLAAGAELMRLAREAVGKNALPFRATRFDKSPSSNWLVVWHQDTALPIHGRTDVPGWGPWSVKEGVLCAGSTIGADRRYSNSLGRFKSGQRCFTGTTWISQERCSKR
jgi:hypothetical protein